MKATFYLPAHPSYFDDVDYTQEQIEAALVRYDRFMGGKLFKGDADMIVKHEYVLLREPGKSIQVIFDSAGMGDDKATGMAKDHAVAQFLRTSNGTLTRHVQNIREHLKMVQR